MGDAQKNVEFYADVLGLRLVKKTVNFDAPDVYHLYFGDESTSRRPAAAAVGRRPRRCLTNKKS
jgi:catechol 2,3-dioxygenase-like lactoylglutathione lyase family enzyme